VSYQVSLRPSAVKGLDSLPGDVQRRVAARLRELAEDPRPHGHVALREQGLKGSFRIHVGRDYVVAYDIDDAQELVDVWQIGNRRSFYEKAKRRQR
jgi:mRNA interferase RelE/StbE